MSRTVYQGDALEWLEAHAVVPGLSFFASLPDKSEFPQLSLVEWKDWFIQSARLLLEKTSDSDVTIFFQSDIKVEGVWVDKAYLCQKAAEAAGSELLWHKVACRAPAGTATFGRPAYSHILCFSRKLRLDPAASTADVLPELGEKSWQRGIGTRAALMIAGFVKKTVGSHTIVNPFCGEGAMLACANHLGLGAIGIEKGKKRAERARELGISADSSHWL